MRSFGSDNHSGVHPDIMKALLAANSQHQIAYGDDDYTQQMKALVKEHFGEQAEPYLVFNGTGANVVSLRACLQPFHSIICAETAHIAVDECGAPEFMTHAALRTIPTPDGKLTPERIAPLLINFGFEHHSQPKVVYISECTELGTVYTPEEIKAIADFIHGYGMYLHLDGARIANAAVTLKKSFKELTVDCGVDIMSFGATKNGLMMGEMVIAFRPELAENLKYLRKQSAQLYSKMRYAACQFMPYLQQDIWRHNAENANQMAQLLRSRIEEAGYRDFTQKTEANILLFRLSADKIEKLLQHTFFYVWNESTSEIRLVTSWDTTQEDVDHFIACLRQIS
ncbi:MAG: aminotransferase class I/II-fold pyridoxal phosphate-dependent enzyme [Bacteroidales bacterium]|nr:aminotransferase class I/II-fold pyridoxal phosphate-dependent enzyme [Bacteroidales bacterium]